MTAPVRIGIAGAGRMGRAIMRLARQSDGLEIVSVWARDPDEADTDLPAGILVSDDIGRVAAEAAVLIDFSLADATPDVASAASTHGRPLVCGVTGLTEQQFAAIENAAQRIPVVYDRNMSEGITVLEEALRRVAGSLGDAFGARVEEVHHAGKKDAPSGTALKLAETVAAARGSAAGDISIDAERRGDVPGEHRVIFESGTEQLEFSHSVTTRDVFAAGALRAAAWVTDRGPGLYSMRNVLFGDG